MRQHGKSIVITATALLVAMCATTATAQAQDGPRKRNFDRDPGPERRAPPRMRGDSGPDRFEKGRTKDRDVDRGRAERSRFERPGDRRPDQPERAGPPRRPRSDRDDAWDQLAMRMRRSGGLERPDWSGLRGFGAAGGSGPPTFAGGMRGGPGGGSRGRDFGGPSTPAGRNDRVTGELRELNRKLDRLISALEQIAQR